MYILQIQDGADDLSETSLLLVEMLTITSVTFASGISSAISFCNRLEAAIFVFNNQNN